MATQNRGAHTSRRTQKIQELQQAWGAVSARLAQQGPMPLDFSLSRQSMYDEIMATRHPTLHQALASEDMTQEW
jgi:hypothetical protein